MPCSTGSRSELRYSKTVRLWPLILAWSAVCAGAAELKPATLQTYAQYIRAAETRMDESIKSGMFLWTDRSPDRRKQVRAGQIVIEPWAGTAITEVPDGLIHDWIGAVFIPGATLAGTLTLVQDYDEHKKYYKPEVIDSRLVSRQGNEFKVYYRLLKKKVITVVLDSDHDVRYYPLDARREYSRSHATRIVEVGKPPGEGHGFLWRLDSYWRFEERDGGTYVECEAVSLSRDVPRGLGWLIEPIVRNLPRESLANTLRATRDALAARIRAAQ